jgi:hypothetical protein
MIVAYVTFEVEPSGLAEFEAWFVPLAEETRNQTGCVAYDYLLDSQRPGQGRMVEIWASPVAYEASHSLLDGRAGLFAHRTGSDRRGGSGSRPGERVGGRIPEAQLGTLSTAELTAARLRPDDPAGGERGTVLRVS